MSGLILWGLRLLVLLLLIRMVLRLLYRAGSSSRPAQRPAPKATERIGGALVRDPQCGTYVTRERAITSGTGASTLYFCSTECRDAYAVKASA